MATAILPCIIRWEDLAPGDLAYDCGFSNERHPLVWCDGEDHEESGWYTVNGIRYTHKNQPEIRVYFDMYGDVESHCAVLVAREIAEADISATWAREEANVRRLVAAINGKR